MRTRGEVFWDWADPILHHRDYDAVLEDGTSIDVQVRLSRTGCTQLFIGVYSPQGRVVSEEYFENRPGETMSTALAWGVDQARRSVTKAL